MIEASVEFHIDVDYILYHLRVSQLHDTQSAGAHHIGGEVEYQLFALSQQILHSCLTDLLLCLFDGVFFPAGQCGTCFVLEVFDDADLTREFGPGNSSFPFTECAGIKSCKAFYVVVVKVTDQLFLSNVIAFSTLFKVFVEMQALP
jgi:hypothetical protein